VRNTRVLRGESESRGGVFRELQQGNFSGEGELVVLLPDRRENS